MHGSSRLSLVSESLAYYNIRGVDNMKADFANHNVYHSYVSPRSLPLDFASPDHFQILRMKGCRSCFDRVVTSVFWPSARFHWHLSGRLTTNFPGTSNRETILRLRCVHELHGSGDFRIISTGGDVQCRLCGQRLAWGIQLYLI